MPTVGYIEDKIRKFEGINVRFLHKDGTDVRSDMELQNSYRHKRRAKDNQTITNFIKNRLKQKFEGYDFEVVDNHGNKIIGITKIGTVRNNSTDIIKL